MISGSLPHIGCQEAYRLKSLSNIVGSGERPSTLAGGEVKIPSSVLANTSSVVLNILSSITAILVLTVLE